MGKRGPAPAPTALKLVRGTRSDRVNSDEPLPGSGEVVCPDWLDGDGRGGGDRLAPDLVAKGVLTAWDVDTFADLCALVVLNRSALADLAERGTRIVSPVKELRDGSVVYATVKNPNWQVARESAALLVTVGGRFGLNP